MVQEKYMRTWKLKPRKNAKNMAKFGRCVTFEIPGAGDDEAVPIFLEFERVKSASGAVVDLNGRYFGGRVVKACLYNLDKFGVLDLVEQV